MEASPLSRLAPELRNQIYELLLFEPNGITITCTNHKTNRVCGDGDTTLALLGTCHRISEEASTIFYAANAFTIRTDYAVLKRFRKAHCCGTFTDRVLARRLGQVAQWLGVIGVRNARHTRNLIYDLGTMCGDRELEEGLRSALHHIGVARTACEPLRQAELRLSFRVQCTYLAGPANSLCIFYNFSMDDVEEMRRSCIHTAESAMPEYRRRLEGPQTQALSGDPRELSALIISVMSS